MQEVDPSASFPALQFFVLCTRVENKNPGNLNRDLTYDKNSDLNYTSNDLNQTFPS